MNANTNDNSIIMTVMTRLEIARNNTRINRQKQTDLSEPQTPTVATQLFTPNPLSSRRILCVEMLSLSLLNIAVCSTVDF